MGVPIPRQRRTLPVVLTVDIAAAAIPVTLFSAVFGGLSLAIAAVSAAIWFAALHWSRTGPVVRQPAEGAGIVAAVGTGVGLVAMLSLPVLYPALRLGLRGLMAISIGVFVASLLLERVGRRVGAGQRVLIVDLAGEGMGLVHDLNRHPGFDSMGVVHCDAEADADADADADVDLSPDGASMPQLRDVVRRTQPDVVVLGDGPERLVAISQLLDGGSDDVRVIGRLQFYEHAFGRVPVEYLSPAWFMGVLHLYHRPYSRAAKRTFDLFAATTALIVSSPLLLVLAVLVRVSSPGPVIFRQTRLGRRGDTFEMLKLRTMVNEAEHDGKPIWATPGDPRETRIGSIMRSARLDELPQLWNVMRGDMSLVGPRPERPEFLELLDRDVPFWTSRHMVKPGITGWAQVNLGYTSDSAGAADKLSYDLYYLRHRSLLLDLAIIGRTVGTVLGGLTYRERPLNHTLVPPPDRIAPGDASGPMP